MQDLTLPPVPHVPGQTPRPDEALFAGLKAALDGCHDPAALAQSACFRGGFEAFARGYYWEAHELWEPVWMALPEGRERALLRGLIQLANAALKRRMGRAGAVARIIALAEAAFEPAFAGGGPVMGVRRAELGWMWDAAGRNE